MADEPDFPRGIQEDPYPFYEELREHAPLYKIPGRDDHFVARWEDIASITQQPELFSNAAPSDGRPEPPLPADYTFDYRPASMAASDPPEHREKRLTGLKLIGRDRLREYAPLIERVADELIDGFATRGEAEFCADFADWLPVRVIAEVLGFPQEDVRDLRRWSDRAGQGARYLTDEELAEERERVAGVHPYLEAAILDRYAAPREDGLSVLVADQVERDGELNLRYLMAEANVLLFAGNATTTHMLASTLLLALQHPDELRRVYEDPALIRTLLEESLRLESPVQFTQRVCTRDTEIGGAVVPAGTTVLCGWASGNRDPRRWEEPDELRLDRADGAKHQLAFGRGPHLCLGAPLARLEGEIAFQRILSRLAGLRLAPGKNDFRHIEHPHLRAPAAVHIEFDPAPGR
jgi:cytochrome P450